MGSIGLWRRGLGSGGRSIGEISLGLGLEREVVRQEREVHRGRCHHGGGVAVVRTSQGGKKGKGF